MKSVLLLLLGGVLGALAAIQLWPGVSQLEWIPDCPAVTVAADGDTPVTPMPASEAAPLASPGAPPDEAALPADPIDQQPSAVDASDVAPAAAPGQANEAQTITETDFESEADTPSPPASLPTTPLPPLPVGLLIPVEGVEAAALRDNYSEARDTRTHEAIDIAAPKGTAARAVDHGRIVKLFDSKAGGLTLYQFDPTETFAYYYAHLDGYAPGAVEGRMVARGEVIGYVGSTGNANPAAPHLHFAIFVLGPEKTWWRGTPVNPYPLLVPPEAAQR